jgi:hypothetical protein
LGFGRAVTTLCRFVRLDINCAVANPTSDFHVWATGPTQTVGVEFFDAAIPPLRQLRWSQQRFMRVHFLHSLLKFAARAPEAGLHTGASAPILYRSV